MTEQRIRAALAEIVEADRVPVEASKRKKWPSAVLAAAAVVAILAVVALTPLWPGRDRSPVTGADGRPSLPEHFPSYSWVQGRLDGPFGRAVALYRNGTGHEDWGFWQLIVVGADRNALRRIDVPTDGNGMQSPALLSPDGTKVVIGDPRTMIRVIDLMTGNVRHYPIPQRGMATGPLAISPDGRRVVFIAYPFMNGEGSVHLIDLDTGEVSVEIGRDVIRAAFSPDGARLALQSIGKVRLLRSDTTVQREISVAEETLLAGAQAWSPDGRHLLTIHYHRGYEAIAVDGGADVRFEIPLDRLPGCWGDAVLGWRSNTAVLLSDGDNRGTTSNLISEVDLATGGEPRVLSRFDVASRDDLAVCDVRLAAALVPELVTRSGSHPDRGMWPWWAIITSGVLIIMPVLISLAVWSFRRRRPRV